jgi:YHS domain-containing protein
MLRFLLIAILLMLIARAFWRVVDGIIEGAGGAERRKQVRPGVKLVRDPVCGTFVTPGGSLSLTSGGSTHYFCSEKCRADYKSRARA